MPSELLESRSLLKRIFRAAAPVHSVLLVAGVIACEKPYRITELSYDPAIR